MWKLVANTAKFTNMKQKKIQVTVLFLVGLLTMELHAQISVNTAGGDVSSSAGSVSYSLGQVVYSSIIGNGVSAEQGIQQPYEILLLTSFEENKGVNLFVMAYPNPTADYLTLHVDESQIANLAYWLCDMDGKILRKENITVNQTNIMMDNLVPSIYFLKVMQNNKEMKIVKIIKK